MKRISNAFHSLIVCLAGALALSGCILDCLVPALPGAWQRDTDFGTGFSVLQSRDGGYVVIGEGAGGEHYTGPPYLLKTDARGNEVWSRVFSEEILQPSAVVEASDGTLIVAGDPGWPVPADVARVGSNGEILWSRQLLEPGQSTRYGGHLVATSDGNFVATSYTASGASRDVRIVKFDLDGETVWTQVLGFPEDYFLRDLAPTADGGVAVLGKDLLLRLASDGGEVWRVVPSAGTSDGQHLAATSDDGVVTVGFDGIAKYNMDGGQVWEKSFLLGGGAFPEVFHALPDGGFVAGGSTGKIGYCRNVLLVKFDDDGDIQWQRKYGTPEIEILDGLTPTADGGYVVLGSNGRGFWGFVNYMFLMKIDADG